MLAGQHMFTIIRPSDHHCLAHPHERQTRARRRGAMSHVRWFYTPQGGGEKKGARGCAWEQGELAALCGGDSRACERAHGGEACAGGEERRLCEAAAARAAHMVGVRGDEDTFDARTHASVRSGACAARGRVSHQPTALQACRAKGKNAHLGAEEALPRARRSTPTQARTWVRSDLSAPRAEGLPRPATRKPQESAREADG